MTEPTAGRARSSRAAHVRAYDGLMSSREKLSDDAIAAFVAANAGWARVEQGGTSALSRTFSFPDYPAGVAFAVRIAFAAEGRDHHPDLLIGWRKVLVTWSTHDAGGITALDAELAQRTDALAR